MRAWGRLLNIILGVQGVGSVEISRVESLPGLPWARHRSEDLILADGHDWASAVWQRW